MSFELADLAANVVGLEKGPKAVLQALCFFADGNGRCFPSQRLLAQRTSYGLRSITTFLAVLEHLGFFVREHRQRKDGSRTTDHSTSSRSGVARQSGPKSNTQPLRFGYANG